MFLIITTQEQKRSTYDREHCATFFALSQYENIFGANFPINVFSDHNPILFLFTRNRNFTRRQRKTQKFLTKFSNLLKNQILVDYSYHQFTFPIQGKGITFTYIPLDSFSFHSLTPYSHEYELSINTK